MSVEHQPMPDETTLSEVMSLVAEVTGVSLAKLRPTSRLLEDLGIDGVDAEELMLEFARRFEVDLCEFDYSRHFGPEAGWSPFCIHPPQDTLPITINDLAEAADRRRWPPAS